MSDRHAASERRGLSVTVQVTVPVRVPTTASLRRAMEMAPPDAAHLGLRQLLRRAWHVATDPDGRPRATRRDDMVASLLGTLLVLGLFLDGWNHINLQEGRLGPFLTPWHYGLYFGFTVTALWVVTRQQQRGQWRLSNVPHGYGLAMVGLALAPFAVGGDALWHTEFGVEVGVTRVISPFHLFLFLSGFLLVTAGLRSAWLSETPATVKTLRAFAPALLSITWGTALVAYFLQYVSPLVTWTPEVLLRVSATTPFQETVQIYEVLGVLVTSLLLVTPVMLILRRWQPPFGTVTVLFGLVALLTAGMTDFARGYLVAATVVGGVIGDLAIARLRPTPSRRAATRAVGVVIPTALGLSNFAALHFAYGITWRPELWIGSTVLAAFTGVALSVLTVPPSLPEAVWSTVEDEVPASAPQRSSRGEGRVLPWPQPVAAVPEQHPVAVPQRIGTPTAVPAQAVAAAAASGRPHSAEQLVTAHLPGTPHGLTHRQVHTGSADTTGVPMHTWAASGPGVEPPRA